MQGTTVSANCFHPGIVRTGFGRDKGLLSLALSATGGLGRVDLAWTASTDNGSIRRYNVHRSTTPGFTPTAANRVGQPTGTSFTDSPLAGGTLPEGRHPTRGVAASGFRPLRNIPHCCLP